MTHHFPQPATFRHFVRDGRGSVAVIFAIVLTMLVAAMGAAVDYTQAAQFHTLLQGAVDDAALAGASAYVSNTTSSSAQTVANNYMNTAIPGLPANKGITFTATPSTTSSSGQTSAYFMSVTATAQVPTTFMAAITGAITVSVAAKAENPIVLAKVISPTGNSSAADKNTIYWYLVPDDGSLPTTKDFVFLYTNDPHDSTKAAPIPVIPATQKIGFALVNITGGLTTYGSNGYGGKQLSTHTFYSQPTVDGEAKVPSAEAYSKISQNCSLQILSVPSSGKSPTPSSGSCFTTPSPYLAPSCQTLNGQTMRYFWNDMGGTKDDKDYNDAEYNFACTSASGSNSGPTTVVLVQ